MFPCELFTWFVARTSHSVFNLVFVWHFTLNPSIDKLSGMKAWLQLCYIWNMQNCTSSYSKFNSLSRRTPKKIAVELVSRHFKGVACALHIKNAATYTPAKTAPMDGLFAHLCTFGVHDTLSLCWFELWCCIALSLYEIIITVSITAVNGKW